MIACVSSVVYALGDVRSLLQWKGLHHNEFSVAFNDSCVLGKAAA